MTRKLYRLLILLLQRLFLRHKLEQCQTHNLELYYNDENRVDIITIAFNNVDLIKQQVRLVNKYVQNKHNYIVADNSSDANAAQEIAQYCLNNRIIYLRLPKNHLGIVGASYSHGASLNWVYQKFILAQRPRYFGFIDHDLFPINCFDVEAKLATSPIYGKVVERNNFWYLWAGLCFYRLNAIEETAVDFLPTTINKCYLDTGGSNWNAIYQHIAYQNLPECSVTTEKIRESASDLYHSDYIQYIDTCWLHLINGSNWAGKRPKSLNALLSNGNKHTWTEVLPKDKTLIDTILKNY